MNKDITAPPLNPLPPVVWLLALPMVAVELVLSLGAGTGFFGPQAVGWRSTAIQAVSVYGPVIDWMMMTGHLPPEHLVRFLAYPFVQWNAMQALLGGAFLLALGKFVAEVYRPWAVLAVFFGAAAAGALAYALLLDDPLPLVGIYPACYGLIGAFTYILWTRLGEVGGSRSRAFALIGVLLLLRLAFAAVDWIFYGGTNGYWLAEIAGFAAGFLVSFVVSPGGWRRVLVRLRQP
jgi:membrane associated rhomboid family serine protease